MRAIILIAGVGKRLRNITENPKCLLEINGVTLLERYLKALASLGVLDVAMVVGYKKEKITEFVKGLNFRGDMKFIENPDFTRGSILALYQASSQLDGDVILMDGDVYFEVRILERLVRCSEENSLALDTTSFSSGEEMMIGIRDGRVLDMKRNLTGNYDTVGEAVGFYRFNQQACVELKAILEEQFNLGRHDLGYEDILPSLFQRIHVEPVIIDGLKWVEIDFKEDILRAERLEESQH